MRILPNRAALPSDILHSQRAVVWKYEARDGAPTKVPYEPQRPTRRAAVDDATTWGSFDDACARVAAGYADGAGIVLGDGLVGIDLDHCRDATTGAITPEARAVITALDSYTEISPSQTGLHVLAHGTLPPGGRRQNGLELYENHRYFTVTGQHLAGTPTMLHERTAALAALHARVFGPSLLLPALTPPVTDAPDLDDAALLARARAATNGAAFAALWAGDTAAYGGDDSAADLALCNFLAFYAGCDRARMDCLFRQSGLMRPKWDSPRGEATYGAHTITKAIADCATIYTGASAPIELEPDDNAASDPLAASTWPTLADEALIGVVGDVVRALCPCTEADPVALLTHLLAGFGSLTGRSPHTLVGATRHHANVNVLVAGDTSVGRKGTAWDEAVTILTDVDPEWAGTRVVGGLSSGEGLIAEVRDASADGEDPGVLDKRLLVVETEFAKVLRVCRREGNTLSTVLRQAWDSGALRTLTRGAPLRATGAHISIVGHVTPRELRQELKAVEMGNGFANRFLIVLVRRSQLLPEGGRLPDQDRADLVARLTHAVMVARARGALTRTDDARDHWRAIYPALTRARDGLVGALCNRGPVQVLRLSLLYALADAAPVITLVHQQAAYALWQFSEASTQYLFGHRVGDQLADYLLEHIRNAEAAGLTATEISAKCGRHQKADAIHAALQTLLEYGVVTSTQEPGKGRAATRWYLREYAKEAK